MVKTIKDRIERTCAVCGGTMRLILYADKHYRGGHYFGKMPLYRKKELEKMRKSGTHASTVIPGAQVCNYDPKPYAYAEYWECSPCDWHPKSRR